MRRKKKILKRILIIIAILLAIFLLYKFVKPQKKIDTSDSEKQKGEIIELTTVNEPNVEIKLPDKIKDEENNTTTDSQNYEPITDNSEDSDKYLISILSNNEVTILIGNDSEKILDNNSKVQIGEEYKVNGIQDKIKSVYYFNVENYKYPIFLLLTQEGKLHYIDIEKSFKTGIFEISGTIENLPEVESVYSSKAEKSGKSYRTAIITCTNGEGYEFSLDMINK